MLTAVINVSEGRDGGRITDLTRAAGDAVLDVHNDADHHRSVFTLGGNDVVDAARALAARAVSILDITGHSGAHPRIGVLDVVPWVNLEGAPLHPAPAGPAVAARADFARWAASTLELPCFLYGPASERRPAVPERSLPELRRRAWHDLAPDIGPSHPHPTAGAAAIGARPALVAYNLWLAESDIDVARQIAREIRSPQVRALGLAVGDWVQVSCNLIDPWIVGPGTVFDSVARRTAVSRAELVGLVPGAVLRAEPPARWSELDLAESKTIEARLEEAGLDGGRFG